MQAEEPGCCPVDSWPALKIEHQPVGEVLEVGGTKLYHVGSGNRVLIFISDIFGAFSGRHQAVADTFASFGFNVYDFEMLDPPYAGPLERSIILAHATSQSQQKMDQKFHDLIKYLKKQGHHHFSLVGFCWGLWQSCRLATKFEGIVNIVGFHPSLGLQKILGGSEIGLINAIKCPVLFVPAGNDPENVKKGGELVQILEGRFGADKVGSVQFPEMIHGWVVRGDVSDDKVRRDVQAAVESARDYLLKF